MAAMDASIQLLLRRLEDSGLREQPPGSYTPPAEYHPPQLHHPHPPLGPHATTPNSFPKYMKLDFPTFDGSKDPLIWLHRCDQFFYHKKTPADDRVQLAAFHMLDETLLWFHQLKNEHLVLDWDVFKQSCMMRLCPPTSSNLLGKLVNLKQTGTIEVYQKIFQECLARASTNVKPSQYVNLLIAGLTEALYLEVELHEPRDLD
ncbi:uncharacterized protein [Aristolochia californica]|uniref:uncharacterized protein n=1 Tax=Aristolochia californica TaxID=171875 RepID=UPI0035DC5D46